MKLIFKSNIIFLLLSFSSFLSVAQINTDRVMNIGRNALYFEDYILSMQYFNQVITWDDIEFTNFLQCL